MFTSKKNIAWMIEYFIRNCVSCETVQQQIKYAMPLYCLYFFTCWIQINPVTSKNELWLNIHYTHKILNIHYTHKIFGSFYSDFYFPHKLWCWYGLIVLQTMLLNYSLLWFSICVPRVAKNNLQNLIRDVVWIKK